MSLQSTVPHIYEGLAWEELPLALRSQLPLHKSDIEKAKAIVALGFPEVQAVLPHLLVWLQDYNWPVAQVLVPFLAGLGRDVVPEVRTVLQGDDEVWIYWVLTKVVAEMPEDAISDLRNALKDLADRPSVEGVDLVALEILDGVDGE
ncbi:MAG: DUF5071 domain-containing protein [Bacteroidetes bacterium]|nr:DUF5071 domain-containing protein [Bacteroidota bacterium]